MPENTFDIPVVLILFKSKDTVLRIIDRLRQIKPMKVYLLSDQGRNEEEISKVADARRTVEDAIDWDCTIIKNYAKENRGVYDTIALQAK